MKVTVMVVGRLREDYLKAAEAEYVKRLKPHCTFTVRELKEDAAVEPALPESGMVVVLDERGELVSSADFAKLLGKGREGGDVTFVIGGADGLSSAVRERAHKVIAFGRMTLAHRLARLILIEQIYRGFTLLTGHPYHR